MKTWIRAEQATLCGGVAPSGNACPHIIAAGAPMLAIALPGIERRKYRCPTCAGEPVPDLPAVVERVFEPPRQPVPIQSLVKSLPLDWKAKQSGREPGSDDE